jgi:hypothetical protein
MDYAASIRRAYAATTPADRETGRAWYPSAERIADAIAERTGTPRDRVAAAIAALSPRNPWYWNVADAAAFADAASAGAETRPTATTFNANADRAWAFVNGAADWKTTALKVRSFVANILGDTDAVTVDVWAIRVATDGAEHAVRNDAQYREIADAYRTVAAEVGETPRDLQAITWVAAERAGLGSQRRGRHGLTFKRGTLPWVPALLAA